MILRNRLAGSEDSHIPHSTFNINLQPPTSNLSSHPISPRPIPRANPQKWPASLPRSASPPQPSSPSSSSSTSRTPSGWASESARPSSPSPPSPTHVVALKIRACSHAKTCGSRNQPASYSSPVPIHMPDQSGCPSKPSPTIHIGFNI